MRIDFAPLEGITGYSFRNAYDTYFDGVARYFTPFVNVNQNLKFGSREERDIDPSNNLVQHLVPQLLTNHADQLAWGICELVQRGYKEVNLNLGCPSGTVMKRHRGAGMLEDPEELGLMLEEAVTLCEKQGIQVGRDVRFSVKTRIGMNDAGRMRELISVYNQIPMSEVIVHPRIGVQGYGGTPDYEKYGEFLEASVHPVIYNGDIRTVEDANWILSEFPETSGLMLGRGLLADPYLAEKINVSVEQDLPVRELSEISQKTEKLQKYHDLLFENYRLQMGEDRNAMARMKEFWVHFGSGPYFPDGREKEKALKEMKKAKNRTEYEVAVGKMMRYALQG